MKYHFIITIFTIVINIKFILSAPSLVPKNKNFVSVDVDRNLEINIESNCHFININQDHINHKPKISVENDILKYYDEDMDHVIKKSNSTKKRELTKDDIGDTEKINATTVPTTRTLIDNIDTPSSTIDSASFNNDDTQDFNFTTTTEYMTTNSLLTSTVKSDSKSIDEFSQNIPTSSTQNDNKWDYSTMESTISTANGQLLTTTVLTPIMQASTETSTPTQSPTTKVLSLSTINSDSISNTTDKTDSSPSTIQPISTVAFSNYENKETSTSQPMEESSSSKINEQLSTNTKFNFETTENPSTKSLLLSTVNSDYITKTTEKTDTSLTENSTKEISTALPLENSSISNTNFQLLSTIAPSAETSMITEYSSTNGLSLSTFSSDSIRTSTSLPIEDISNSTTNIRRSIVESSTISEYPSTTGLLISQSTIKTHDNTDSPPLPSSENDNVQSSTAASIENTSILSTNKQLLTTTLHTTISKSLYSTTEYTTTSGLGNSTETSNSPSESTTSGKSTITISDISNRAINTETITENIRTTNIDDSTALPRELAIKDIFPKSFPDSKPNNRKPRCSKKCKKNHKRNKRKCNKKPISFIDDFLKKHKIRPSKYNYIESFQKYVN